MFKKITVYIERHLLVGLERTSSNPILTAIRTGLVLTLPLVMAGSFAILINSFPVPGYQKFMESIFGKGWHSFGGSIWNATFGVISFIVPFSIGYVLAERHNLKNLINQANPVITGIICMASLVSMFHLSSFGDPVQAWIPQQWTGAPGLFLAIIVAVIASHSFLFFSKKKVLRLRLLGGNIDFAIPHAFSALIPGLITISTFAFTGMLVQYLSGMSVPEALHYLIRSPFDWVGDSLGRAIMYVCSLDGLWFLGIHGSNVLDPITHSIYNATMYNNIIAVVIPETLNKVAQLAANATNTQAILLPVPEFPHIITKGFLDVFVFIGGSGCTLTLAVSIFLFSPEKGQKRLAGISFIPGLFNINEILLYGLPVVLNPVLLVPFLLTPVILLVTSYAAVKFGFVPPTRAIVEWTTPVFLSGYLSTGSINGAILQAINMVLGVLIYAPFILIGEKIRKRHVKIAFGELYNRACNINTTYASQRCLGRVDAAGALAGGLLVDLEQACTSGEGLFLEYQPQVMAKTRKMFGVESLLRWHHPQHGLIPAPITVALAEEGGLIHRLGLLIMREGIATRRRWLDAGIQRLIMSINISTLQLRPELVGQVKSLLQQYNMPPYLIEIEVTESSALDPESAENKILQDLNNLGLRLAIDDFGMGHSSLKYLKQFPVDVVKIDGAITKEVTTNPICADIVASITKLCRARDIISVVEFVETEEQVQELLRHGTDVFQGWLFSKSLPEEECLKYIIKNM